MSLTEAEDVESATAFRPRPDAASDPAGEAGWFLQRERERLGLDLDATADATGIHPYHLEALELGDLTRLPARMETLKMAGLYAQYLGFDPEPLVYHYAALLPKPPPAPAAAHPANPDPLSSAKVIRFGKPSRISRLALGGFPGGAGGIVASCLGAVLLFGAASWYLQPGDSEAPAPRIAAVEKPAQAPEIVDQTGSVSTTEQVLADDQPAEPGWNMGEAADPNAVPPEEDFGGMTEFIEDKVGVAAAPAAEKIPAAAPKATGAQTSRLVLKAKAPVWVRVEDSRGNVVMTQMLMKGDSYKVPAREGLVVIARDGGLLAYEIDGKERGILGPPGEILVGRPLDIKALEEQG